MLRTAPCCTSSCQLAVEALGVASTEHRWLGQGSLDATAANSLPVLLLRVWLPWLLCLSTDSITSFDNRPASSSSSSTRSPPGASSRRGISSSTVAGPKPSSGGDSGNSVSSCSSKNIIQRGNLSVAEPWSEAAPLTLDFVPLPKGRCVGWTLTADALAKTACAQKSAEK